MILLRLFFEFFLIGLLIFGGGLAAVPFLKQLAERTGWYTLEQLTGMIAVSEATPGPIGVNMATYAGFEVAGMPGALAAASGIVLPSVIIALAVARFLVRFKENELVKSVLYGLRPASLALIAVAGVSVLQLSLVRIELMGEAGIPVYRLEPGAFLLAVVLLLLTNQFKKVHPAIFLAGSAAAGVIAAL